MIKLFFVAFGTLCAFMASIAFEFYALSIIFGLALCISLCEVYFAFTAKNKKDENA